MASKEWYLERAAMNLGDSERVLGDPDGYARDYALAGIGYAILALAGIALELQQRYEFTLQTIHEME